LGDENCLGYYNEEEEGRLKERKFVESFLGQQDSSKESG